MRLPSRPGVLALGLGALAMAGTPFTAVQQEPTFRGGIETVAIYATVLDRYGEMVLDLARESFEVRDDGKPQEITVFRRGLQPITAILLLDTSASMTLNLDLARGAAEQFIIRLLPGDKARVGTFSDRIDLSDVFTGNRDELIASLEENMHIGNPTMLWDALDRTMNELRSIDGRRVIMVLTDGMDTFSALREEDVLERARGEDLMIYVVQFRSNARANLAEAPLSPTAAQLFSGDPRVRSGAPTALLRRLATRTGGGHFLLTQHDDVNSTFTHVMHELHYQYILGFVPQRHDGHHHELRVQVGRPDLTVRARQGYLAPRAQPGATP